MLHLNFKTYGSGEHTLIIIHGFLGSLDNWHTLATRWGEAGIQVFSLDMRNHGKSPHTHTHSIDDMVQDVVDFMQQQHLSSATLLGHSMGGKVAMQCALNHPGLVEKLIVADMAPRAYRHGHDDVFKAIQNIDLSAVQSRKEAEDAMKPYLGDFGTRQFILKNLERTDSGHYSWKFNLTTLLHEYEEILKPIDSVTTYSHPALFLKGELSVYIKDTDREHILKLFPLAKVVSVSQAGHWLHADQPEIFFKYVHDFVTD
ncbi:MAG: alpha/beta fold hydrolase [Bacteroidota bacterium]